MSSWKDRIYWASRSRGFLWRFALVTLLAGVLVGMSVSSIAPPDPWAFGDRTLALVGLRAAEEEVEESIPAEMRPELVKMLREELAAPSVEFFHLLVAVPGVAPYLKSMPDEEIRQLFRARFPENQAVLAADYLAAWNRPTGDAFQRIEAAATAAPQRYDQYVLGRLELKKKNPRAAFEHFHREATVRGGAESQYLAVVALAETDDFEALATLEADPLFSPYFDAHTRLNIAEKKKDWRGILRWVPMVQLESYRLELVAVSLVAGLAWAVFLLNLGEIPRLLSSRTGLCGLAFIAGVLSTTVTIYVVVWQDRILGHNPGTTIQQGLVYFIAGVGLREELCKLLLFAPFLPILLHRGDELEAVLVASFVGLGFAIEENAGYFLASSAADAPGRFLTANFFHIALTGMNGLFLYRACRWGAAGLNQFLFVLPLTILVHGVYDALLGSADAEVGPFVSMVIYVLFCQYYFRSVEPLRSRRRTILGLTGSFIFGVSVLGATVIAFQMAVYGVVAGGTLIFSELLGSVALLFIFLRETNESLTA